MFRRLFWLVVGLVLGVLLWRKVTQVARAYSPEGLAERAQARAVSTADGLRAFAGEVSVLAERREAELRRAFAENTPVAAQRPRRQPSRHRGDGRELRGRARSGNRHGD